MATLVNTEKLPLEVRKLVEPYLDKLLGIYQTRIKSVVIYGSATGADFVPGKSNVNIAIVLDRVDVGTLRMGLKVVADGRKRRIVAPLFLTGSFIERSADVFPLEFIEIRDNHVVVFGEDIFSSLGIDEANLRLQCEEQLKGSLLRLRQAYLELGLKKKGIEALLIDSLTSIIPAMRGMLRLKGITPPREKSSVISQIGETFNADAETMLAILRDKRGDEKIGGEDADKVLTRYMECVRDLGVKVDEL